MLISHMRRFASFRGFQVLRCESFFEILFCRFSVSKTGGIFGLKLHGINGLEGLLQMYCSIYT